MTTLSCYVVNLWGSLTLLNSSLKSTSLFPLYFNSFFSLLFTIICSAWKLTLSVADSVAQVLMGLVFSLIIQVPNRWSQLSSSPGSNTGAFSGPLMTKYSPGASIESSTLTSCSRYADLLNFLWLQESVEVLRSNILPVVARKESSHGKLDCLWSYSLKHHIRSDRWVRRYRVISKPLNFR